MRVFFKFIIILLILGSGVFIAKKLIETKPVAKRKPISIGAPLVEVITAETRHEQVKIIAMGTVVPAKEVAIQPRVSGHIVEISPELIPGGFFKAGDLLLRIDDRDYKIAAAQRKAELSSALTELKLEQGKQTIAKREWELLGSEIPTTDAGRDLILRKPHLKKAVATLDAARSMLKKAELDVERTQIRAPFNGFVKEKFADMGQAVNSGTKLLTLVGTDEFWIQISVPVHQLSQISVPGVNGTEGSAVSVIQESSASGENPIVRRGRVVRLLGDLDPVGRMARLLVSVHDPFGLENTAVPESEEAPNTADSPLDSVLPDPQQPEFSLPLLIGAYVTAEIEGPYLENVFVIPRKAFREDDRVWLLTDEKKLAIKTAELVWKRRDDMLVRGLKKGDQIITSRIAAPVEGMDLRTADD